MQPSDEEDPIEHTEHLLAQADDLDKRIEVSTTRVAVEGLAELPASVKRLNIVVGVLMVVVLTMIVVGFILVIRIENNTSSLKDECKRTNVANANEVKLWTRILDIPPQSPQTAEQQKNRADFRLFMLDTFAPEDCSKL